MAKKDTPRKVLSREKKVTVFGNQGAAALREYEKRKGELEPHRRMDSAMLHPSLKREGVQ